MANEEQLSLLLEGVDGWDSWREENLNAAIDLSGASLSDADLWHANLSYANIGLSKAIRTNFMDADLTGASITDWHINRKTKFERVKCSYIYRGYNLEQEKFTDRLPVNSDQEFKPGEFEEWTKVSAEARQTIDLTFTEGIDWQAFFQSLQGVRQKYPDSGVGLQAIVKKKDAIVISLETSPDTNQSAIESSQKELYKTQLQLSKAQGEIRVLREMSDVLKQLAGRPMNEFNIQNAANVAGDVHGNQQAIQHNYAGEIRQTPAESAKEIQDLLLQLKESNPTDIESVVEQRVKSDPTLRDRIRNALKEGGLETMKVILPLTGIAIETVRGWVEAEGD